MHPRIIELQRELVTLTAEFLLAGSEVLALALLADFQSRIEAALAVVEARA